MAIPIGVQLYSVRDDSERDLFGTLAAVAKMGYDAVEFFSYNGGPGYHGKDAKEIRSVLDDLGLRVCGTHANITSMEGDVLSTTVEVHNILGCQNLIIPWIPEDRRNTPDACKATAEALTVIVERLRPLGYRAGFHVHDGDVKPLEGGKSAWDLLGELTPSDFIMQYDTANGMSGGADPVAPILAFPGKGKSTHLKEFPHGTILGQGTVPWAEVFKACETVGGTEWYVIEHESYEGVTPMEAIDLCLKGLRALGK